MSFDYNKWRRAWRLKNRQRYLAQTRRYRERNRERINKQRQQWRQQERIVVSEKLYRRSPRGKAVMKQAAKRYRERHPDRLREAWKCRHPKRWAKVDYRIKVLLRNRLWKAVVKGHRAARTIELLGCSIPNFIIYLESRFEPGMSWETYGKGPGKWEIDHIIPCALFDLTKHDHQRRCFHFSNMQPMWSVENAAKGKMAPELMSGSGQEGGGLG